MKAEHSSLFRLLTLAIVFFTALGTTPRFLAAAEPRAAIGSVTSVGSVELRGIPVVHDATLFAGDVVRSGPNSSAKLALSSGHKVELGSNSEVTVGETGVLAEVALALGNLAFSGSGQSPMVVRIAPFEVSLTDAGSGSVSLEGPDTVGVRASAGSLLVRNTENLESFVLTPGQERMLGRWNGAVAQPLGQIAATVPGPIPAPGAPQAQTPVSGTGMSTAAWLSVLAAVGGGASVGGWFWGDADKVDQEALDAAQDALDAAEAENAGLQNTVNSLNSQITGLNAEVTSLNGQIATLGEDNADLEAQLIGVQDAASLEINAVESQLGAVQTGFSASQLQLAVAASGLSPAAMDALNAQADSIIASATSLNAQADTLQDEIAAIKAQIAATSTSEVGIPDGAGPITTGLYNQLTERQNQLANIRSQINANINALNSLLQNAQNQGVMNLPGHVTTIPGPTLINASQSAPV
jgi:predicted  nucleic acid-binding Zn-ribbon protein